MRRFYTILFAALVIDLLFIPFLVFSNWLPRFTLALLPLAFLFTTGEAALVTLIVIAVFYWLTTGLNLGLIVLALGTTLFFMRQILPRFFHKEAWQTLVISSLGVLLFGLVLFGLTALLIPASFQFSAALATSFLFSTALAILLSKFLKRAASY